MSSQVKKKQIVILITGPTASGKTGISIELAKLIKNNYQLQSAIVNFDSLLFYEELNIGTAKPTQEEMQEVEHYLIGIRSVHSPYNASEFVEDSTRVIKELHEEKKVVILVGGSGFYIRALLKGMYESGTTPDNIRKEVEELYQEEGIQPFLEILKIHDPESFERLHENDHYRVMRAVEFFKTTGKKISELKKTFDANDPYDFSKNKFPEWNLFHIHLDLPKDEHFKIIVERTKSMLDNGLINEVKSLLSSGFSGEEKPLKSIGYKEVIDFLSQKLPGTELIEKINISTRKLAKAQRTFFKKCLNKRTYHPLNERESLQAEIKEFLTSGPCQIPPKS